MIRRHRTGREWRNGRRAGFRIRWATVRVQVPPLAPGCRRTSSNGKGEPQSDENQRGRRFRRRTEDHGRDPGGRGGPPDRAGVHGASPDGSGAGVPQGEGSDGDGEADVPRFGRGRGVGALGEGVAHRGGEGKGPQGPLPAGRRGGEGRPREGFRLLRHRRGRPRGRAGRLQGDPRGEGKVSVTDDDVSAAVERLRESFAQFHAVEGRGAAESDLVEFGFTAVAGGETVDRSDSTGVVLSGGIPYGEEFERRMLGVEPGMTRAFDVAYPADFR